MKNIQSIVDNLSCDLQQSFKVVPTQAEKLAAFDLSSDILSGVEKASQSTDIVVEEGYSFLARDLYDGTRVVFYTAGESTQHADLLRLLAYTVDYNYDNRDFLKERSAFLKNILLENELPGDIPLKARDFEIDYFTRRQVLLLNFVEACDLTCTEVIQDLLLEGDFVLSIDENNVVIIASLADREEDAWQVMSLAILEAYKKYGRQVYIGIGMPAEHLKDAATSYRQAAMALIIGDIFKENEQIMWYKRLGLGRLIYQLPPTLCEMFLSEVFAPDTYEALDPETLLTIDKFFENNLNGSETSRQLFVHRNTLVYRLDKVQKITGLDLRTFEDAVLFKLASMVRKYLESLQQKNEAHNFRNNW